MVGMTLLKYRYDFGQLAVLVGTCFTAVAEELRNAVWMVLLEIVRECRDFGLIEDRSHVNHFAECLLQSIDEQSGANRIATELKEIVIHANLSEVEQLRPVIDEHCFQLSTRRNELRVERRSIVVRRRQGSAVQLSVGR